MTAVSRGPRYDPSLHSPTPASDSRDLESVSALRRRGLYLTFIPTALGLTLGGLVVPLFWGFIAYLFEWYV